MVPQLPDDILQEITEHINSDLRTLCSCALASRAWVRYCQVWIFRRVDLRSSDDKPRFIKLREVLEKNPSLADHTRELHLFPSFGDMQLELKEYAQFLSCFKRLEKVSINKGWAFRGDALSKALARVFELETLRSLTLRGSWRFPKTLLMRRTSCLLADVKVPNPKQSSPTPTSQIQNDHPPARIRMPLALSLECLRPEAIEACTGPRGILQSRWIDKLVLSSDDRSSDVIERCCRLLRAVGKGRGEAECLSHFEWKSSEH